MMKKVVKNIFLFLSLQFMVLSSTYAQNYSRQEIKAAFVCNFAKFTTWPVTKESKNKEFIIGVIGSHDFGNSLEAISKNLTIGDRKVKIVYYSNPFVAISADLLYIGVLNPSYDLKELLKLFAKNNVLTISEKQGFCQFGGLINFSKQKNNYGFEINANYSSISKLKFQAKLLKLATLVK